MTSWPSTRRAPAAGSTPTDVLAVTSPTEDRNPRTADIDQLPVTTLLERINDEDALVAGAVRQALPALAKLVEVAVTGPTVGWRKRLV